MTRARPKRILFIKEGRDMYGAENATVRLLKCLDRSQISPSFLILEYTTVPSQFLAHICDRDAPVFVAYSSRELGRKLRELAAECDAVVSIGYKCHILSWWYGRNLAVERFAICHGWVATDLKLKAYNWIAQRCLNSCKAVMVVSPTISVNNRNCVTIFNGVDIKEIEADALCEATFPFEVDTTHTVIAYIGRLEKEKGVRELVHAMAGTDDGVELILAGAGSLRGELDTIVTDTGVNVRFLGHLENTASLIKRADCLILPSASEGLPLVILEAMALGTPVLATPVGAVPVLVKDGKTGFILPTNSVADIQNGIERIVQEQGNVDPIIGAAKAMVLSEFSDVAVAERVTHVLTGGN